MGLASNCKHQILFGRNLNSITCKGLALIVIALRSLSLDSDNGIRKDKFLEVPQIVWGLNNQKIAFARACLTARMLNRTLLMPSFSASLFYKEIDRLQPISFDKVFQFDRFDSLCNGFVQLGSFSDLRNQTGVFELQKGSGRKWTAERDLDQLKQFIKDPFDGYEVIRISGRILLVEEIAKEAGRVVSKIREVGKEISSKIGSAQSDFGSDSSLLEPVPYVAVHMRIEIDWMIHCKKLERKLNVKSGEHCGLKGPAVVYLAVADSLLEDSSILTGWKDGLVPVEKNNSATQKMIRMGITSSCGADVRWPSYAYNILGESNGPHKWMTNMSDSSLKAISYGSNIISC
ncbi:O-fucosyltransferase [Salix suchowensis]|nr:O-fucosyltransferase [Salix suchowensis]